VFPFVLAGFLISLCLHEFGHAFVAYHCGDTTVEEKGYLTLNPLLYTDLQYSILFPILIMAIGGVGLPGGAVYINTDLLRRRIYGALVSAGGPLATAVVLAALMLAINLAFKPVAPDPVLYAAVAYLAMRRADVQPAPCPGLDGWGIPAVSALTSPRGRRAASWCWLSWWSRSSLCLPPAGSGSGLRAVSSSGSTHVSPERLWLFQFWR
jgi:hypothetical protein